MSAEILLGSNIYCEEGLSMTSDNFSSGARAFDRIYVRAGETRTIVLHAPADAVVVDERTEIGSTGRSGSSALKAHSRNLPSDQRIS
jgi:hypothetical protein